MNSTQMNNWLNSLIHLSRENSLSVVGSVACQGSVGVTEKSMVAPKVPG